MKAVDIPQADSLSRVRELVSTVQFGATDAQRLQRVMTLHPRHVGYHLHAARILNWLEKGADGWAVTAGGDKLLGTQPGTDAERTLFRAAIEASPSLKVIAPGLLADTPPEQGALSMRIQEEAGIAPATARRRASTLLRWRTQSLPMKGRKLPLISYEGAATDDASGAGLRVHAVSAQRYGVLQSVRAEFGDHVVLVGANASGKSTLLDVFAFISDALGGGVTAAIEARATGFEKLVWFGEGDAFAFAVEFNIPAGVQSEHSRARYELEVGRLEEGGVGVRAEALYLCHRESPPRDLIQTSTPRGWRKVLGSIQGGQIRFGTEQSGSRKATNAQVSPDRLGLAQLPDEPARFPVTRRILNLLAGGIRRACLSPSALATPCAADAAPTLADDGAGFAAALKDLQDNDGDTFEAWVGDVREAFGNIESIGFETTPNGETGVTVKFLGGHEVSAGQLSSGQLRLMGLTAMARIKRPETLYVVDAPEVGLDPRAIQAIAGGLGTSSGPQMVLTSQSAAWIGATPLERVQCFVREAGAVRVIPALHLEIMQAWEQAPSAALLFGAGLLA